VGIVVDNKDPLKLQRVRVRYPWMKNVPDNMLPWSMPGQHEGGGQMSGESGGQKIPPIGSKVLARFNGNNPYHPVHKQGPTTQDRKVDELANHESYPEVSGHVDAAGNLSQHDLKNNKITNVHQSGTMTEIDKDGNTKQVVAKDHNHSTNGKHQVASKGEMYHSSEGRHDIIGSVVHINSSGPKSVAGVTPRKKPDPVTPGSSGFA
jgi:hypothetical protein